MDKPRMLILRHFETDPRVNGFTARYDVVVAAAQSCWVVDEVTVGPMGSGASLELDDQVFETSRRGRVARMRAAVGFGGPFAAAARALDSFAQSRSADVVLGCTYRSPELYGRVARHLPTFVFIEERPRAFGYGDAVRSTPRSRAIATLERYGLRILLGPVRALAVIRDEEIEPARRRWRKPVLVVPHAILPEAFIGEFDESLAVDVLTVGNFAERRNADGLKQFLVALAAADLDGTITVAAISATGYADELACFAGTRFDPRPPVEFLGAAYASASMVLVPSQATSGSKTTVLQAWAAKRPIVASTESARSVDAMDQIDLLIGDTAQEMVEQCRLLLANPELGLRLVEAGGRHLALRHSEASVVTALCELINGDLRRMQ